MALPLELPGLSALPQQYPEGRFGPCLTPMSACDVQMSPTSICSPGFGMSSTYTGFSISSPLATPCLEAMSMASPVRVEPMSMASPARLENIMSIASPSQRWSSAATPFNTPVNMPVTPGTEIRQNAASFGIPLSLQPVGGEGAVPIPVRTNAGLVFAPSPTRRRDGYASFASTLETVLPAGTTTIVSQGTSATMPAMMPQQLAPRLVSTPMSPARLAPMAPMSPARVVPSTAPGLGNRPFVTPFSAGMRASRRGGVGGA